MKSKAYRRRLKWFRDNPEKRREYNRRYYLKRAEILRELAKLKRIANPGYVADANKRFRERNPEYLPTYRERVKLKRALTTWATICASNRQTL